MSEAVAIIDVAERIAAGGLQGFYQEVLGRLRSSDPCRCLVLWFHDTDASDPRADEHTGLALMGLLLEGGKPVIAAVEGEIVDSALSLAAAADYLVAAADASFSSRYLSSGAWPPTGLLWGLANKLGAVQAKALVTQGRAWDSAAAARAFLAQDVVPPGQALSVALNVAARYAAVAQAGFTRLKALWAGSAGTLEWALQLQPTQPVLRSAEVRASSDQPRILRDDAVAVIECGASAGWQHALVQGLQLLDGDAEVRAVVLGSTLFAQQANLASGFCGDGTNPLLAAKPAQALLACNKPLVAALEGPVSGEALWLLLGADVLLAAEDAVLSAEGLCSGRMPDARLLWSLRRKAVPGALWAWLSLNGRCTAALAEQLGLIHQRVPPGGTTVAAVALAHRLAALPPLALAFLKASLMEGADTPARVLRTEIDLQPLLRQSADHREAVAAFMEKRSPRFRGS